MRVGGLSRKSLRPQCIFETMLTKPWGAPEQRLPIKLGHTGQKWSGEGQILLCSETSWVQAALEEPELGSPSCNIRKFLLITSQAFCVLLRDSSDIPSCPQRSRRSLSLVMSKWDLESLFCHEFYEFFLLGIRRTFLCSHSMGTRIWSLCLSEYFFHHSVMYTYSNTLHLTL